MKKKLLLIIVSLCLSSLLFSQKNKDSLQIIDKQQNENLSFKNKKFNPSVQISSKKFQDSSKIGLNREPRAYMSLSRYKKKYKEILTKEDSTNFIYRDSDTLILISNKDFYKKRVSVPYESKDSSFLELYKDVVFKKYSNPKKKKYYMKYWKEPIKIYFSNSLDNYYKKEIKETAIKLSKEIDSLEITFVKNLEKSNYIIYQVDEKHTYKYTKRISKNDYIDYYLFWKNNKIYDAKLELNLTKYKNISKKNNANYLVQYFFRSLGYFMPTKMLSCENILSNCNSNEKKITAMDLEILKYHYSYGICKGTDLNTFEDIHKGAKETFLKTGKYPHFTHSN